MISIFFAISYWLVAVKLLLKSNIKLIVFTDKKEKNNWNAYVTLFNSETMCKQPDEILNVNKKGIVEHDQPTNY